MLRIDFVAVVVETAEGGCSRALCKLQAWTKYVKLI